MAKIELDALGKRNSQFHTNLVISAEGNLKRNSRNSYLADMHKSSDNASKNNQIINELVNKGKRVNYIL